MPDQVTGSPEHEPPRHPRWVDLTAEEQEAITRQIDAEYMHKHAVGEMHPTTYRVIHRDAEGNFHVGHSRRGGPMVWRRVIWRSRVSTGVRHVSCGTTRRRVHSGARQMRRTSGKRSEDPPGGDDDPDSDPGLRSIAVVVPAYLVGLLVRSAAVAGLSVRDYADRILSVADFDLPELEVFFDVVVAAKAATGGEA